MLDFMFNRNHIQHTYAIEYVNTYIFSREDGEAGQPCGAA